MPKHEVEKRTTAAHDHASVAHEVAMRLHELDVFEEEMRSRRARRLELMHAPPPAPSVIHIVHDASASGGHHVAHVSARQFDALARSATREEEEQRQRRADAEAAAAAADAATAARDATSARAKGRWGLVLNTSKALNGFGDAAVSAAAAAAAAAAAPGASAENAEPNAGTGTAMLPNGEISSPAARTRWSAARNMARATSALSNRKSAAASR